MKSRALQAQMPEVLFECSLSNFLVCTSFLLGTLSLCRLLFAVLLLIILNKTGKFVLSEENESVLASSIVSIVILVLGNISPKLPRSRYTGLRLPWTVADETTWVVAHRILGYTSIPFGVFNLIVGFSNIKAEFRNEVAIGTFVIWVLIASVVSGIFFHKTR